MSDEIKNEETEVKQDENIDKNETLDVKASFDPSILEVAENKHESLIDGDQDINELPSLEEEDPNAILEQAIQKKVELPTKPRSAARPRSSTRPAAPPMNAAIEMVKKVEEKPIPHVPDEKSNITEESKTPEESFVLESDMAQEEEEPEETIVEETEDEDVEFNTEDLFIPHQDLSKGETADVELVLDEKGEIVVDNKPEEESAKVEKAVAKLDKRIQRRTSSVIYGNGIGDNILSSVATENTMLKELRKLEIPNNKVVAVNTDEKSTHQAFLKQYTSPSQSPIIAPRMVRFPLLLSGYYAEMRNYTYGEHQSVVRNATNPDLKFSTRLQEELISLFSHIVWTSIKPNISFDEWVAFTKFPDLQQFYYGAFDATYPGETPYNITCGIESCANQFTVTKNNRELNYAVHKSITDRFLHDVLLEKIPASELKNTPIYKEANTLYEEKVLPQIHFKVHYGVPSILDVLEWLAAFDDQLSDDFEDFNGLLDETVSGHNVLKLYTYIQKLTVPVIVGKDNKGRNILRFKCIDATKDDIVNDSNSLSNKKMIISLLKNLDKDIFRELFTGEEVAKKLRLVGIVHMLHNVKCPACGTNLIRIPIDMQDTFFTEAIKTVRAIAQY